MGDTVNLSQRLQQLAAAGETVLSEATVTCRSPARWPLVALEEQLVKGRDTPVVAYKLVSPGQRRHQAAARLVPPNRRPRLDIEGGTR